MLHSVGDLLQSVDAGFILQQVNAQGVMGSGFAAAVKSKYPAVYEEYCNRIKQNTYHQGYDYMGTYHVVQVQPELYVVNIVSQRFYGRDGKRYTSYDALDTALKSIAELVPPGVDVHHPMIGAGLGGGHWSVIRCIIEHRLGPNTMLWTLPTS